MQLGFPAAFPVAKGGTSSLRARMFMCRVTQVNEIVDFSAAVAFQIISLQQLMKLA